MPFVALAKKGLIFCKKFKMFYVYIIQSIEKQDEFYTWFSENLKQRLEEHNTWKSIHTNKHKPWELVFYSAFKNKKDALYFEKYLKSASWIAFRNKRLVSKV